MQCDGNQISEIRCSLDPDKSTGPDAVVNSKDVQGLSKSLKVLLLVKSGVLQGSILGLLLFLLFVNDLTEAMDNADNDGYTQDFNAIILNQNDMNQKPKREIGLTIK